jgi:hypothetical protein
MVVAGVKEIIKALEDEYEQREEERRGICFPRIMILSDRRVILKHCTATQAVQVKRVLGWFTPEEDHLLKMVLWKIQKDEHSMMFLIEQLVSCIEHDTVVCMTGRKTRVLSVLQYGNDGAMKLCTMNDLRKEVLQLASKVRGDALEAWTPEEIDGYQNGNTELASQLRDTLVKEMKSIYKSSKYLDMLINESAEYF